MKTAVKSFQVKKPKNDKSVLITFRLEGGQEAQVRLPDDLAVQMVKGLTLALNPQALNRLGQKQKTVH